MLAALTGQGRVDAAALRRKVANELLEEKSVRRMSVTFGSFDDPGYGRLLGIKLVLVVASVALAAVHGVIAARNPKRARPLALLGVGASVAIVVFATALVP